jgi:hypothetical protein
MLTSFLGWVFNTVATAADAEMNDDTALREQLLDAEMRREMGEISDEEFAEFEADVLQRIREIKERKQGGAGPIAFGGDAMGSTTDNPFQIEATISGDFHEPETEHVESLNLVPEPEPEPPPRRTSRKIRKS